MGVLLINDEIREQIRSAIERARANPISVEDLKQFAIAADTVVHSLKDRAKDFKRPESQHVILGTYRASISFEQQPAGLCRHLSVSALKPGTIPNRPVLEEIATLFGINRPPEAGHIWLEEFAPGHLAVNFLLLEDILQ